MKQSKWHYIIPSNHNHSNRFDSIDGNHRWVMIMIIFDIWLSDTGHNLRLQTLQTDITSMTADIRVWIIEANRFFFRELVIAIKLDHNTLEIWEISLYQFVHLMDNTEKPIFLVDLPSSNDFINYTRLKFSRNIDDWLSFMKASYCCLPSP